MFFRMLKKDLQKKKTVNIVLLMFIVLASMFLASGINNVVTVMNGTDNYLDKAGIGDFVIITMGGKSEISEGRNSTVEKILRNEKTVKDYRIENVVYGSEGNVENISGKKLKAKNTTIFQSLSGSKIKFFDKDNKRITDIRTGHVYVSGDFIADNKLNIGDKIRLVHESVELVLTIDGKAKDALLGSDYMGNTRFILSDGDYNALLSDDNIKSNYRGQICYVDTDNERDVASAISACTDIAFAKGRSVIKMCYVMDMVVAFVTLVLSVCLIIVSFVVLRFSINFTVLEEYREIGVMKAIGISNIKIRSMYVAKYLFMALIGSALGFILSIPFGNMLIKSVSDNMVLNNSYGYYINVIGAFIVVLITVLFSYLCTGKVKKSSPLDAIRSGQTGERYNKKKGYRISKSHTGTSLYLAVNDVLSSPKRFISIIVAFFLCTTLVLMVVNTTSTMKSDRLIKTFGSKSDLYITDVKKSMEYMSGYDRNGIENDLHKKESELAGAGMPSHMCTEIQFTYPVTFEGKNYNLSFQQGLGTKASDYEYIEGTAPQAGDEIAITPAVSELIGAKIGDTLVVHLKDKDEKCIVTAYYDTMNQLGEVIRFHESANTDMGHCASVLALQINFKDNPTEKVIEKRKEKVKQIFNNDRVMNAAEYCADTIGVVDTMESVQYLLLGITFVVVMLVTILMERTLIAGEISQIAILKAIGFTDGAVIKWHMYRFGIASMVAVILAGIMSIPMTKLCITPIFGMMGATHFKYKVDIVKVFIAYPGAIFAATLIFAFITALYTRKIKSSDTSNIE